MTEVNLRNMIDSHKESYLEKVRFEARMKQVNLDSELLLLGLSPQVVDKHSHIGLVNPSTLSMTLSQSVED